MPKRILIGALIVFVVSACERDVPVAEATLRSPEARARGRATFVQHCALCHGENADGRGARRDALVGTMPDFTSGAFRNAAKPAAVYGAIRDGKPGTSMPAWRTLGDPAIADLTAYVLSVKDQGR